MKKDPIRRYTQQNIKIGNKKGARLNGEIK
jgi:hypothetical protein